MINRWCSFVNYLFFIIEKCLTDEPENKNAFVKNKIMAHRAAVIRNLEKYTNDFGVFNNYSRVGNYCNYFCNNFLNGYPDLDVKT